MHRRALLSRPSRGAAAVLAVAVVAAGCSSAVKVQPFEASDSPECLEVAARWPGTVAGQPQRVTAVDSEGVAAWGDPPVIARCGALSPGPTTDPCQDVEGVDWVAHRFEDGSGFAMTTYGRVPAIEVLVPPAYESPWLLLPAFTQAALVRPQERSCS